MTASRFKAHIFIAFAMGMSFMSVFIDTLRGTGDLWTILQVCYLLYGTYYLAKAYDEFFPQEG